MNQFDAVVENLYELVCDRYKYALRTRGDEYADYDDFENRFLAHLSDDEKVEVFRRAYLKVNDRACLSKLLLLSSSYQVKFHKVYFELLRDDDFDERKREFVKLIINKMSAWTSHEINEISDNDRTLLLNMCKQYGVEVPNYLCE